jgi:hypothetical protein
MKEKPRLSLVPDPVVQPVYRQLRDIPSEPSDPPCADYSPLRRLLNRCFCVLISGHDYELQRGGILVSTYACRHCAKEL